MRPCSPNIMPDGLTGAILAVEGIRDAAVILNGPTGCKFYHSAVADSQFPRELSFDPLSYPEQYYFGQPRVPATYLDGYDYVYGSAAKLEKILPAVAARGHRLIMVVNSPGAALIGDDLKRLVSRETTGIPCLVLESTGFSGDFARGFQNALLKVLDHLLVEKPGKIPRSVNLIGISIYHKYYAGSIKEIKGMLEMCGIAVLATLCAGDTLENILNLPRAACNVVIYPEYGLELAQWLYEKYDLPYVTSPEGPPVGFAATECFVKTIARRLGAEASPALEALERARARCYLHLSRFNSLTGLPGGSTFSLRADPATAYALTGWLSSYLGMIPVAVELTGDSGGAFARRLAGFLEQMGRSNALASPVASTPADIFLGDGNTLAQLKLQNIHCCGLEISLPSLGYLDVTEKSLFGAAGALMLVEQVINGLRFL